MLRLACLHRTPWHICTVGLQSQPCQLLASSVLPLTTAFIVLWTVALPIGVLVYNSDHLCVGWARSKHSLHINTTVSIYEIFPARCVDVQQQKTVWITLSFVQTLEASIAWPSKMDKCCSLSSGFVLTKLITHLSSLLLLSNLCIHHIFGTWC